MYIDSGIRKATDHNKYDAVTQSVDILIKPKKMLCKILTYKIPPFQC